MNLITFVVVVIPDQDCLCFIITDWYSWLWC